jgi:hypothetical protein
MGDDAGLLGANLPGQLVGDALQKSARSINFHGWSHDLPVRGATEKALAFTSVLQEKGSRTRRCLRPAAPASVNCRQKQVVHCGLQRDSRP